MEKLKVGIIGAGRIGQVHAKSITYHIPQAEIVAISDIYVDGAKKVAQELGIPNYYEDYHERLMRYLFAHQRIRTQISLLKRLRQAKIFSAKSLLI